ncbi:FAD-dependent monooxygenase [Streptomyces geranii]|uniref:FAD-dependent monooxygenase n=1 Tax=Streptomyces geranii TaxID=2058923 RepID=UPI000D039014|nr:FAD-dependent monooxygenase [Streptomyces geranii]
MKVIVVGAGIGGLAAALSLRASGHEVTLVERTARFTEIGAGIQLAPNATRVLRDLGLLDTVAARASRPAAMTFRTWSDGTEICRYVLGREAETEFGAPYLQVHRADLHQALAAPFPPSSVRLDTEIVAVDQDDTKAYVTTADGERLAADLVVAADGVRSAVRERLFGADRAVFSGTAAYRALLPAAEVADLDLPDYAGWLGPGRHIVHYWVRGGQLLNLVAVFTTGTGTGSRAGTAPWGESWTARAEPGEQLREFTGWDPRLLTALERAGQVFRYGIHTRTPLTRWNVGRVALLGDSAHAMTPFQAQGAAQALMDAAVLGDCLTGVTPAEIPDALDSYVHRRLPTATRVQSGSANAGDAYHLPDGPAAEERNTRMAEYGTENRFGPHSRAWGSGRGEP